MSDQFDNNSAKRISRCVRAYETTGLDKRKPLTPFHPILAANLPKPQYQYQFFGGVSQNQTGFMFIPANAIETSTGTE